LSFQYQILNGDALLENIKDHIEGEFIVCREALIEGPLHFENFEKNRAQFLGVSEVNLWFEDDLFCQCNLWYLVNFILSIPLKANVYLVRPTTDSWLGFGAMDQASFAQAYQNKISLTDDHLLSFQNLWKVYSKEIEGDLLTACQSLTKIIPRIEEVIQAHLDREEPVNKPMQTLKRILEDSEDKSFPSVFKQFSSLMGIYGFGDTSVKVMYEQLTNPK